jgi:hypothetical protein
MSFLQEIAGKKGGLHTAWPRAGVFVRRHFMWLGFLRNRAPGVAIPLQSYHVAVIYVDRCGIAISEV